MANGKAELTKEQLENTFSAVIHRDHCHVVKCNGIGCQRTADEACDCGAVDIERFLYTALAEAERVDKLHGWVPCSERLPDHALRVAVYCQRLGSLSVSRFMDGRWVTPPYWRGAGADVTHWCEIGPLPEVEEAPHD